MFLKRISAVGLVFGLTLITGGCLETAPAKNDKLRAPAPEGPPVVGRGGMFQDANGCYVFAGPKGGLQPLIGAGGNPVCE